MSSGGATLQGSFSGETGAISEVGFYYGTTSNPSTKVIATGTSSPFTKALTGLASNTTYYYKAYVIEGGEERTGSVLYFTTADAAATATVTTLSATNINPTTVTLNGQFSGATGTIYDRGFRYRILGTSTWITVGLNSTTGTSGSFSVNLSCLQEGTTYEFQAYVQEHNGITNSGEYRYGSTLTFSTTTSGNQVPTYLEDYGIPDVAALLNGKGTSGTNSDRGDHWFRYNTTNNNRQIAVHTYTHPDTNAETVNYVVMYDGSRYAPLWTAHTMNTTYWPDKGVTRSNDWTEDPAISLTQIEGLNDNSTYSRGHFVASSYRKSTDDQNAQTFYYTNKAPQYQTGFNQGVWSDLEDRVKAIAPSGTTTMLYVVTGVLYEGTLTYMPKGSYSVPLPSHFYKCIMKCTLNGSGVPTQAWGIAFVYTNTSHSGDSYYKSGYYTSIDEIEQRAGFNFFSKVPDNLESEAEANTDHRWFTGAANLAPKSYNSWKSR